MREEPPLRGETMQMTTETPQRVAVVVEQNKSGTWSVSAYLVTADGRRDRRSLAVRDTYEEATSALKTVWQSVELPN